MTTLNTIPVADATDRTKPVRDSEVMSGESKPKQVDLEFQWSGEAVKNFQKQ